MKSLLITIPMVGLLLFATIVAAADEKKSEAVQPICPVMGGEIDKNVSTDYLGGKLYFCCAACIDKFTSDKEKYATKANLQLVQTGQAKQTGCPITGRKPNAGKTVKVAGVDVHFCCGGCLHKVNSAKPEEQLDMVFGKGFSKGFTVAKK